MRHGGLAREQILQLHTHAIQCVAAAVCRALIRSLLLVHHKGKERVREGDDERGRCAVARSTVTNDGLSFPHFAKRTNLSGFVRSGLTTARWRGLSRAQVCSEHVESALACVFGLWPAGGMLMSTVRLTEHSGGVFVRVCASPGSSGGSQSEQCMRMRKTIRRI
jgi:hypothetical protein